jgi:alkylation response protein AidB-like acyl-CoA dehydrogenase
MTVPSDATLLERARQLADEVLFPRALKADRGPGVPVDQLDALADAGLYGASVHAAPETVTTLIETLASGCMTTTFVWAQHLGATAAAHFSEGPANRYAEDLAAGRLRGGVAFAHMLRPDPPLTTAVRSDDGWVFNGSAPWVTGWGHIDLFHAAARHEGDIVWGLLDAADSATLRCIELDLATVAATRTVVLEYDNHPVPDDRVTRVESHAAWLAVYRERLRNNGSFPLGVASRCCTLLERPAFDRRLNEVRDALDAASTEDMPSARADAALFAVQASTALVAATGGRAVTLNHHAQRLHREAMFLLVQGQTPRIREHMLDRLGPL